MDRNRELQNSFQKLMHKAAQIEKNTSGPACKQCWFYRPDFRYRRCLYATCRYGKGNEVVFRKKPLHKEKFPKREVT